MKRVAIVICSQGGQTKKVADFMAQQISSSGCSAEVFNLTDGQIPGEASLKHFQSVVIGGPVYFGEFSEQLLDWAGSNCEQLNRMQSGFFAISLNAVDRRPRNRQACERYLRRFISKTDLRPKFVASLAGTVPYTQFGYVKRSILKAMSAVAGAPTDTSVDHDLTEWVDVAEFTNACLSDDTRSRYAVGNKARHESESQVMMGLARTA